MVRDMLLLRTIRLSQAFAMLLFFAFAALPNAADAHTSSPSPSTSSAELRQNVRPACCRSESPRHFRPCGRTYLDERDALAEADGSDDDRPRDLSVVLGQTSKTRFPLAAPQFFCLLPVTPTVEALIACILPRGPPQGAR